MYSIAIIGGGAAGIMAVLRGVLNNDNCLLFSGDKTAKRKSRGFWVSRVENMPGFHQYKKGISDPNKDTLKWIKESPFSEKLNIVNTSIVGIEKLASGEFELVDSKDEKYKVDYVVMCTGLMDIQPEINDSIKPILPYANMQTVDYCLRCDGHHTLGKNTGIIGHTNGAAWVACMLYERYENPSMSIFTNGEEADFSGEVVDMIKMYNIKIYTEKIIDIIGEERGKVLKGFKLEGGDIIPVEFSFVSLGMILYNELAVSLGANVDKRGFVEADSVGQTNISGLYIAGDLRANKKMQIYTAWDMAVDSVDHINMSIRQRKRKLALN